MNSITLPAPAKLNLFLHINSQRPDNYHNLQTIFQLIDWCDWLTFTKKASGGPTLASKQAELTGPDNLILKACHAVEQQLGRTLPVHIELTKNLAVGGGIGGGSSDAATTLHGLNRLFDLRLSTQQLVEIGRPLGADVPVFVRGKTAWAEGIGDQLTPITLPERWYVILHPNVHVSTADLFRNAQLTRNTPLSTIRPALADEGRNDFEPVVRALYPEINKVFLAAQKYGEARLTGTGACLFLSTTDEFSAQAMLTNLQQDIANLKGHVARGHNESPVLDALSATK